MIYNVGSNLFNVLGNYLLIFGKLGLPKLGVAGAAISTSVSRFLACVVGLCVVFFLKWSAISIRLKGSYRINFDIAREIFFNRFAVGNGTICGSGRTYDVCPYGFKPGVP